MKAFRIKISSYTGSFRHPTIITGKQPTLQVPPVSVIMGIFSAVCGTIITTKDVDFGYVFEGLTRFYDLETIHKIDKITKDKMDIKSDIVSREMFFNPVLYLYIKDEKLAGKFRKPFYPLLLGRSNDLATVEEVKEVELEKQSDVYLYGTCVPFSREKIIPGYIQSLPTYFVYEDGSLVRKPKEIKPYILVNEPHLSDDTLWTDETLVSKLKNRMLKNKHVGLFWYEN